MLKEGYATWQCADHEISLTRPRIMGILNVTPDSFSDGGTNGSVEAAVERAKRMLDEGADIIDVGGESTRPGHTPISSTEEAERVVPVVRELVKTGAPISVDTRHADVAKLCIKLGAAIVNDVSGFTDSAMIEAVSSSTCGCVVMHWDNGSSTSSRKEVTLETSKPSRAIPSSQRFTLPDEAPLMRSVMGFLGDQARSLVRAGVSAKRICVDPGAGFDKSFDEDVVIQRATKKMASMGYPLMCAVSRKRFTGALSGVKEALDRDYASAGIAIAAVESGARILRVHNVAATFQAVSTYWATSRRDARQAFVSIGSNVGNRVEYLSKATALIDKIPLTCVVNVSNAYETDPAYGIATPVANAVIEIRTELHPMVLIDELLAVENALGRTRDPKQAGHGARTIDCDLVWVEGEEHFGDKLTLPHPGLFERDYVLVPMEDLMHDPVRFLTHAGVPVAEKSERVGKVRSELGPIIWE